MLQQLATFVEGIRLSGLLKPAQMEQLAAWAGADEPDPQTIAREIVKRGWLTAYQVKMFWKGRADELFLNQYVLLDRVGEGGMGEVYKARHLRMDRIVALKVIRPEKLKNRDAVKRFGREVQAAGSLAHENIVMAYDADQANGRHFFAMEFVDGRNLSQLVKEKHPLPIIDACDYARQAALGLQHAFEMGMVHRDIKPSNLLLSGRGVVKVLDMGLARLLDSEDGGEEQSRITQEGLVVGTPDYLAPEQARNPRNTDIRADVYALGCTLYYLLCGHPPYEGGTPTEKMLRHSVEPTPPFTRPDVPPDLTEIVYKMMAKRPEDRYPTPAHVAYALQMFLNPASVPPPYFNPMPAQPAVALPAATVPLVPPALPAAPPPPARPPAAIDNTFRLPPRDPEKAPPPDRSRRNLLIALAVGLLVLGASAWGIRHLVQKYGGPVDPNYEKVHVNNFDIKFVLIPAGTFNMGSPPDEMGRAADEGPVHQVKITKPFYMSATEVTLAQYKAVMGKLPRAYRDDPDDLGMPVAFVTHAEALAFVERLNKAPDSRQPGWEYRLPTEAEWEYACRAGTAGKFWSGGNLDKKQAHYGEVKGAGPTRCGQFPANAWGLHDMHGNVAEWTADSYDDNYYANSPPEDPSGPESKRSIYVARGGGFEDNPSGCRSARRAAMKEETSSADLGFRVVYARVRK